MGGKPKQDKTLVNLQKRQFALAQKQKTIEEQKQKSRRAAVIAAQRQRDVGFGGKLKRNISNGMGNNPGGLL